MKKKITKKEFYERKLRNAKKWLLGGLFITVFTYFFPLGNYYILAWGPIIFGLYDYIVARYNYFKYEHSDEYIEVKEELSFSKKTKAFAREMAVVFSIFLVLNSFVIASFEVPTGSMENEIMTGDFLLVNKFVFGGTTPRTIPLTNIKIPAFKLPSFWEVERGDVIVFIFPGYREEVEADMFAYYLKRCIAVAGDTLQIKNRVVYVNGVPAPIPENMKFNSPMLHGQGMVDERIFPKGAPFNEDNYGPIIIPKQGQVIPLTPENYFVWETFIKREGHSISMRGGQIQVDGQAVTSYTVGRDYVFGMGDNRDNSLDSRFWGFIPKDDVIGTPLIVYWSWNPDLSLFNIFDKLATVRWNRIGTLVD